MKKIMFNDRYGLTQAVLDGRKTMTRRIVPKSFFSTEHDIEDNNTLVFEDMFGDWHDIRKSRYALKTGEIIAIAQSYRDAGVSFLPVEDEEFGCYNFPAEQTNGWTNKMFVCAALMPHQIRITNVRVEKLQEISDEDCIKEGIYMDVDPMNPQAFIYIFHNAPQWYFSSREAFATLIDKVSGKGTWESNPYVFAYDFKLVK